MKNMLTRKRGPSMNDANLAHKALNAVQQLEALSGFPYTGEPLEIPFPGDVVQEIVFSHFLLQRALCAINKVTCQEWTIEVFEQSRTSSRCVIALLPQREKSNARPLLDKVRAAAFVLREETILEKACTFVLEVARRVYGNRGSARLHGTPQNERDQA